MRYIIRKFISSVGRAAIPFWKYLLNCRRMVLNEHEDLDTWLDFVSLCRHGGNRLVLYFALIEYLAVIEVIFERQSIQMFSKI